MLIKPEVPELVDEYICRIYKIYADIEVDDFNEYVQSFIAERQLNGWCFINEYEDINGIRLKFTKGIGDFAED